MMLEQASGQSTLIRALVTGRATLLIGQRHSPGLFDALRRDVAAITHQPGEDDLIRLLSAVREDSSLEALRRAVDVHAVAAELAEIADNPWSYVLTSAIDPQVHEAFHGLSVASRQLRVLFAGRSGTLGRPSAATLPFLRLFGALDERDPDYRPPTSDIELRRRQRLDVPHVLTDLPFLLGPGGHLAVIGVGTDDWLDVEVLALSCTDLGPGSIHWFGGTEQPISDEALRDLFGERLVSYPRSLPAELAAAPSTTERVALDKAREQLVHPVGRRLTVGRGRDVRIATLTPAEWRRISQVAVVLDDEAIQPPDVIPRDQERRAFRDFLYRVQRIPDWTGIARGFLFEREAASALLELIEGELAAPRSVHASDDVSREDVSRRSSRLPILVEGPPASGKSRLLQWVAFHLRLRGWIVVYVPPTPGRSSFEQIERVCRLLEMKAETACVVIADNLDANDYEQLGEVLASSGRRSVVVGALNTLQRPATTERLAGEDDRLGAPRPSASYTPFPIASRLTDEEAARFLGFLSDRGFPDMGLARNVVQQRLFLLLLYRLLPDSRGNIHLSVAQEYERLVSALERHLGHVEATDQETSAHWQNQLSVIRRQLFPDLVVAEAEGERSQFAHDPELIEAVELALFCSMIERPLSLDLLLRTRGSRFLTSYQLFSRAMQETALLQETELDLEGSVGVEAEHPFVADVTLRSLMPDRSGQLELVAPLIRAVRWDESAFPGDNSDQDFVVSVLQTVGPRGTSAQRFDSPHALEQIVGLLEEVRVGHGARLPQLLLLEANALRLLADRGVSSFEDAIARCSDAIEILLDAEQILLSRRPSGSRNAQLQNVLTTRAVVHGFVCGACLREYPNAGDESRARLREVLREHLDEVNRDTTRARSMGGSYFPLDVSFWAHRDQLEQLPDLTEAERVSLLGKLESVLEVAAEEPIETAQYDRFRRRVVDLAQLQGDVDAVESVAAELRRAGDYSADCIIARRKAFDPATRRTRSRDAAQEALASLFHYAPAILGSEEALVLMHHLWMGVHLENQPIGGEEPVHARVGREDWITWRQILESRLSLPAYEASPYLNFCLAWTLLSLDEPVRAMQVFRANEALAIGNRRRIGTLAVVTDEDGVPVEYRGTVRRAEGGQAVLYVPRLMSEVRVPARAQADLAVVTHVGDEWQFGLALNYQGVLPIPLAQ